MRERVTRTYFLTSNPVIEVDDHHELNPANGFVDALNELSEPGEGLLFVSSNPDDIEGTEHYAEEIQEAFNNSGFEFPDYAILDWRTKKQASYLVKHSGVIFLAGGHVPTENDFFRKIHLARLLNECPGTVVGASAGSMNCASTVYACPEYDEEVLNKKYRRFIKGLGLTDTMIMPHFQDVQDCVRAGMRVVEDIMFPDSMGRAFICLPDGSYVLGYQGHEEICGEAWYVSNGSIRHMD